MRYNTLFINDFKFLYGAKRNNHFLKEFFCDMRNKVKESGFHFKSLFFHAYYKNSEIQ